MDLPLLAQATPAANVLTDVLTFAPHTQNAVFPDVGAGGQLGTLRSLVLCNRDDDDTTFRVALALQGAADTPAQYLYYDVPLAGNDTFLAEFATGIRIRRGDVVRVRTANGMCSVLVAATVEDV